MAVSKVMQFLKDNLLIVLIIVAVAIGLILGFGLRGVWSHRELRKVYYLEFPGRILINMLKLLILPLVVSSLISGMASLGSRATGKIGGAAVFYYLTTTLSAVIMGIILVIMIHPGQPDDRRKLVRRGSSKDTRPMDAVLDLILQCFPDNIITATFQRKITEVGKKNFTLSIDPITNRTRWVIEDNPHLVTKGGTNVLGIVVFSMVLGLIINRLGEEGIPLKNFFFSLNEVMMVCINAVIWFTPVGLISLVAGKFVTTEDLNNVWRGLTFYMITVITGLSIHAFAVLPLLFFLTTKTNPYQFGLNMLQAIFTAWGTASSSATMPVTMNCLIEKNNVDINIVRFVVPVGATINMDGTALYEAVASIYIGQLNGMDLSMADIIIISLTATAAAIGAAGVPQAGLVTMVIVLTAVGLPTEDVTFILAVDWFLDRFRTAVNVWGDAVGAGIINHYYKDTLSADQVKTLTEDDPKGILASLPEPRLEDDKTKREDSLDSYVMLDYDGAASSVDPAPVAVRYLPRPSRHIASNVDLASKVDKKKLRECQEYRTAPPEAAATTDNGVEITRM